MKAKIVIITILVVLLANAGFSQTLTGIPTSVKTPEALASWLSSEFTYQFEFPDSWQSPSVTIEKKAGDCEDFAFLAAEFLRENGYEDVKVIVVNFKGLNIGHAICIWKNADGTYDFITNKKMYVTKQTSLQDVVKAFYPDCSSISYLS